MDTEETQSPINSAVWDQPAMRAALCVRDVGSVYRRLQRAGVAQREIAALTGQAQSDVSEILSGRSVISYHLLTRIAEGLGAPRGYLGLAYDDTTAALLAAAREAGRITGETPRDELRASVERLLSPRRRHGDL